MDPAFASGSASLLWMVLIVAGALLIGVLMATQALRSRRRGQRLDPAADAAVKRLYDERGPPGKDA